MKKLIVLIFLSLFSIKVIGQAQVVKEPTVTGEIVLPDGIFPVTPPSDSWATYFRTDGNQYKWNGTTETCISCGGSEVNDLSTAVTWINIPNAYITAASIIQHQSSLTITESQISDLAHTVDTDTQLSQTDIEAFGFVTGAHTEASSSVTITSITSAETVTQTDVENGILFHQTTGANTVTVDPMALDYTGGVGWFIFFKNTSGSTMTIANGAGVTGASHTVINGDYLTLFSKVDDVWDIYNKPSSGGTSFAEWALFTGTRLGGDLTLKLGDYDNLNNGTQISLDDGLGTLDLIANEVILNSVDAIEMPLVSIAEINAKGNKALITKEYLEANASSTMATTTYDNTTSGMSATNGKTAIDELSLRMDGFTNAFAEKEISSTPYTLLEQDIIDGVVHFITIDTQVIKIPVMDLGDNYIAYFRHEGTGSNPTTKEVIIEPETGVNQNQYTITGSDKFFSLYSRTDDVWQKGRGDIVVSTYTPPVVSAIPIIETYHQTEIPTDATTVVATAPTGIQDDDILLMIVSLDHGGTDANATSTGWTEIANDAGSGSHQHIVLWKRASSESGNYTVNWTDAQDGAVTIARISGAETTGSPFDVLGTVVTGNAADAIADDITSTEDNTLAISYVTVDRNYRIDNTDTVSGTGWTLISDGASFGAQGIGFMWAQKDLPTAGSATPQPTFSTISDGYTVQTINIKGN